MQRRSQITASQGRAVAIGAQGRKVSIREAWAPWFPADAFDGYQAFLEAKGEPLKKETRTDVRLLRRSASIETGKEAVLFVLKVYRYPFWPRLRTWARTSKAEREFQNLLRLRRMKIPAVEPVGFGRERDRLGFVRSCFLITRYAGGTVDLNEWVRRGGEGGGPAGAVRDEIYRQVGGMLRQLHQVRFFLFGAKAKNILLRQRENGEPELLFVDLPYARSQRWGVLDRWAQSRDIAYFLATFLPDATDEERAPFYQAYLPDPLGGSPEALKREVGRAVRVNRNRTPISALVHRVKRNLRRRRRSARRGTPSGSTGH